MYCEMMVEGGWERIWAARNTELAGIVSYQQTSYAVLSPTRFQIVQIGVWYLAGEQVVMPRKITDKEMDHGRTRVLLLANLC